MKRFLHFTLLAAAAGLIATAQEMPEGTAPQADSDPGRTVARISLMSGDVSVRRGDSGDWVAATINAPLLNDDRIFTGPGARAEVQFDFYHRIRLASDTEVRLTDLDTARFMMQVSRGTVTFAAIKGGDAQVEVSTPSAAVRPVAFGDYRITVMADGTSQVTVRRGEAEIFTPRGTERLRPGRTLMVRDTAGEAEFQYVATLPTDAWDEFNRDRDRDLERRGESYRYVSRDVYGAEDLQGQGEWVNAAPYGMVWQPNVADDWAPYRNGRWSWYDYYGWTWVSYDNWGWAPYHYGRWFWYGNRWSWYPGAMGMRHYWSPALVAWFGWGGGGIGVSAGWGGGWGSFGWVPLAPFEPYHRWWGSRWYGGFRNNNYYNNVNVVNNYNIYNNYRNARIMNAVSVGDAGSFGRGISGRAMRGGEMPLDRASLMRGALPVTPQRESLRLTDRNAGAIPRGNDNVHFVSRGAISNSGASRVNFETQRSAMEGFSRQAGAASTSPVRGNAETGRGVWRNVDTPASQAPASRGDWQRFGDPRGSTDQGSTPRGSEAGTGNRGFGDPSAARSGWSTGGRSASSGTVRGSEPRATAPVESAPRGGWSTGGRSSSSEAPRSVPSTGGGYSRGSEPRSAPSMESPRSTAPRQAPQAEAPRSTGSSSGRTRNFSDNGGSGYGGYSSRGDAGRGYSPAPSYSAPSYSAPRSAPSYGGGGGGFSAPRSAPSGGGGGNGGGFSRGGGGGGGSSRGGRGR